MLYLELNAFALAVLLLILHNMNYRADQYLIDKKLFLFLIYTNAVILVLDAGMWVLDGIPGTQISVVYTIVTVIYYLLNPLVPVIWYFYVDFYIFRSNERIAKVPLSILIPFVVNAVLSVMSAFGNYLFYIDAANVYHRGSLFVITALISLYYLLRSIAILLIKKEKVKKQDFLTLLSFALPPAVGAFIQNFHYGVSLIWVCVTISILIIFLGIQNDKLYRDYLTGLYNRRQLDNFLMTKTKTNGKMIGGLMIDINDFKSINDRFGHKSGDEALQSTAAVLTDTFGKDAFISRYGGDEFVVVIEACDEQELEEAVSRLSKNINRFNSESGKKYDLSFSIGYDSCPVDDLSMFIDHIDSLMYTHKQNTKPEKPSKTEGEY